MDGLISGVRRELGLSPGPIDAPDELRPVVGEQVHPPAKPDDVSRQLRRLGSRWRPATAALHDVATGRANVLDPGALERLRPMQAQAQAVSGALLVQGAGEGARHVPRAPRTTRNSAELLVRNEQYLPRLYQDLEAAKHSITISQFNWEPDGSGRRVIDLLTQKAREGVDVRVMVDAYGFRERGFAAARAVQDELEAAGVQVRRSWPFLPRQGWEHRKLITIDDRVAFMGGLGFGQKYDTWTDLMVRVDGPAGAVAGAHGLTTWRDLAGPLDGRDAARLRSIHSQLRSATIGQRFDGGAGAGVTLLENRPGVDLAATEAFLRDARSATKQLWATSTYMTTPLAAKELIAAARRGVDVKLVVSGPEVGNDTKTIHVGRTHYREMLDAGVEVYERTSGIMHAKSWIADGVTTVGSMNLSHSSMKRAREVMARVEDADFARSYEEFHTTLRSEARQVTPQLLDEAKGLKALTVARKALGLKF